MLEQTVPVLAALKPPTPPDTVYSFEVPLLGFFPWLYDWVLPDPCKILWFACTLLLGPAGRWLTGWHSPEQCEGFHRPTLSQWAIYISQWNKRENWDRMDDFFTQGTSWPLCKKAFIVSLSAKLLLEWNIYNILGTCCHISSFVLLEFIFYCPSWVRY